MKLSKEEIEFYKKEAYRFCEMALEDKSKMIEQFKIECDSNNDLVWSILIPALTDVYCSVKRGDITRDEAIEQQRAIINSIDIVD